MDWRRHAETYCGLAGKDERWQYADRAVSRKRHSYPVWAVLIRGHSSDSKEAGTMTASVIFYVSVTAVAVFGLYLAYRAKRQ